MIKNNDNGILKNKYNYNLKILEGHTKIKVNG